MNIRTASLCRLPHPLLLTFSLSIASLAIAEELPEHVEAEPTAKLIASVGYEYLKDASAPGQESSQTTIPFALARVTDDYLFEVHVPYIQRTAPSGKVAIGHHHEGQEHGATTAPLVSNAGLGDITASLVMPLTEEKSSPTSFYAKGEIKFATASLAKGLGTGANDYSVEFIAKHAVASYHGEASLGYAKLGSPGTVEINDVIRTFYYRNIYFGSLNGAYHLSEQLEAGMKLELGQAAEAGGVQQRDLSATAEYKLATDKSIRVELLKSLASGVDIRGFSATFFTPF